MAPSDGQPPLSLDAKSSDPLLPGAQDNAKLDDDMDDDINSVTIALTRQPTMGTQVRAMSKMSAEGSNLAPVVTSPWSTSKGQSGMRNTAAVKAVRRRLRKQVMISCFIMFAEGYYATQVFPYVASMAEELRHSQKNVGFYSGLLYTCQSVGMLLTAVQWARLSNKLGRRPCLLTGLVSNTIMTAAVAVSNDFWLTFVLRLMSGIMNSNLSLMRTALRESFSYEEEDDTAAFSTLSVAFGASCVAGPSMGGLLFGQSLPFDIGDGWVRPWTIPMLSCTLLYSVTLVATFLVMPETAFLTERVVPDRAKGKTAIKEPPQNGKTADLLKDARFLLLMVVGGGHSFVFTGWELAYPLVARLPHDDAGEGWSTAEIGITFLVGSIGLMLYSLVIYPRIVRKVSVLWLWIYSWVIPIVVMPTFPRVLTSVVNAGVESHAFLVQCLNYGAQLFISVLLGSCFISIQLLLNTYVSTRPGAKAELAVANSWLVSTQALVRAVSPLSTGALFTIGIQAELDHSEFVSRSLPFDSLALIGLFACVACALDFERRGQAARDIGT